VLLWVAPAVAKAAMETGVARKEIDLEEYRQQFNNPYFAAKAGYVDDVIEPKETRPKIIASLSALRDKYADHPPRKHGNIPV
jgi:acetyl-CoA carboxylase carboxyltransferase component